MLDAESSAKKCICAGSVILKENKVLVLKHKKLNKWLYPGGHVDPGETPTEAAVREAKEETGFDVKILGERRLNLPAGDVSEEPAPLVTFYERVPLKDGLHMHFDMVYTAKVLGEQGPLAEGESKEMKWIGESEIESLDTFDNAKSALRYAFQMVRDGRLEI